MNRFRGLSESEFFEKWRMFYPAMKEKYQAIDRARYHSHPELSRKKMRDSYKKHSEQRRADAKSARARMKLDPARLERYRKYCRERARERAKSDQNWLMKKRMRTRILMALKFRKKAASTAELIGCSLEHLRQYLQNKFKPGMTWANCGRYGWHVDHIVPCSAFDLRQPDQQRACFHYSNLQPLWYLENLSKGDRLTHV